MQHLLTSKYFKKCGFRRLIRIMRGYKILKDSNSLNLIAAINRSLTSQRLEITDHYFSKNIFGVAIGRAEIVCRQYLLMCVAGLNLNRALLHFHGKPGSTVKFYIPPEWRETIQSKGFKINSFVTPILWQVYVGLSLARGVLMMANIVFNGVIALFKQRQKQLGRYAYFDSLSSGNLPQPGGDGRSYDIITWYMQWTDRVSNLDTICHGVTKSAGKAVKGTKVVPVESFIPPLMCIGLIARFTLWSLVAILVASRDYLRGRWWHALLLKEAALAAHARLQKPELLAKDYLFHNSNWIYRPLWTYEAEKIGARITFYFYSTNCEGFKQPDGYPPLNYGWQSMSWPHYLVWDDYQADFVRRAAGEDARVTVIGPIWFSTCTTDMSNVNGKSVAVFDVTPHRSSRYRILGADFEYYVPETCMPFLRDIQQATQDTGYKMLWKRKRKIGSFEHPRYRMFKDCLSRFENVIAIDPDISAFRCIDASTHVISMPFTSTALIAREFGKPSCYYDPTGLVQKDDRAAHGIEVVSGHEELTRWIKVNTNAASLSPS